MIAVTGASSGRSASYYATVVYFAKHLRLHS
jgi:hypothetical protein